MQFWLLISCHSHSQGKNKTFLQESSKYLNKKTNSEGFSQLKPRASAEKFPRGGGRQRKKTKKLQNEKYHYISLLSFYLQYLYHVWKSKGAPCPPSPAADTHGWNMPKMHYFGNNSQRLPGRLPFSDVVLKTGLKTIFLRSWSWPKRSWSWTILRIWKIAVLRPQFLCQKSSVFRPKKDLKILILDETKF